MYPGSVLVVRQRDGRIWPPLPAFCCDFFLLKFISTRNKCGILYQIKRLKNELFNEAPCHLISKVAYSNDSRKQLSGGFFLYRVSGNLNLQSYNIA